MTAAKLRDTFCKVNEQNSSELSVWEREERGMGVVFEGKTSLTRMRERSSIGRRSEEQTVDNILVETLWVESLLKVSFDLLNYLTNDS